MNKDYYSDDISNTESVSISAPHQEDALQIINSSHEVILRLSYEEYALIKQWQLAQAKAWKAANDLTLESKEAGPPLRDSHGNGRDPRSRKSSLRDAETCEGAVSESMQFINSSGEVVGEIPLPQSGSVTELGNGFTCECCNEIDRLSDAIAVVLELHEPDGDYCGECSIHDAVTYPCPTVVAIRTALGEGEK